MLNPPFLPDLDSAVAGPAETGDAIVILPANGMTVMAEELRNQLVCAAEISGSTMIDGAAVQTIGQAVLQLLVAARCDAIAAKNRFEIIRPSEALLRTAQACCLTEAIGLESGKAVTL